jgi:N-acetylglutamate synthase-like GNAT family acetyltransferase
MSKTLNQLDKKVIVDNIVSQMLDFWSGPKRNTWLENSYLKIYVRKGYHYIENQTETCFDLANVEVLEEYRSLGIFQAVLERILIEFQGEIIFAESILNKRLIPFFRRYGFHKANENEISNNMFLRN